MMKIDLLKTIYAIADALDLVGVDDFFHGKRVALMAIQCAKALNWSEHDQEAIFEASLLHDCGVSSTAMHHTLVTELESHDSNLHCEKGYYLLKDIPSLVTELESHDSNLHCEKGYYLLKDIPFLSQYALMIKYHHTRWEDLININELSHHEKLMANLIFLVDRVDMFSAKYYSDQSSLLHRYEIQNQIQRHRDTLFSSELIDAFLTVSKAESFWLELNPSFILNYLAHFAQKHKKHSLDAESFKKIAKIFAEIVDTKSHFTAEHSVGVANVSKYLAEQYGFVKMHVYAVEIAGYLHDLGKLVIPDEILEKQGPLTENERTLMSRHSFETYQILKNIPGLEQIAMWAGYHHETPTGEGYPFKLNGNQLPIEARMIRVADIFQALAQTRPYRKALTAEETFAKLVEIIQPMQGSLEAHLLEMIQNNLNHIYELSLNSVSA